jgi:hypothetical protein
LGVFILDLKTAWLDALCHTLAYCTLAVALGIERSPASISGLSCPWLVSLAYRCSQPDLGST